MSARVALPRTGRKTGCYGLEMQDGTNYNARPGGTVVVEDHHASEIASSSNGKLGLISAVMQTSLGTKRGRWCSPCKRLWQAWSDTCPRCNEPTVPEGSELE